MIEQLRAAPDSFVLGMVLKLDCAELGKQTRGHKLIIRGAEYKNHGPNIYSIKTPNPKCCLYWCLIEFIQTEDTVSWYFRPLL